MLFLVFLFGLFSCILYSIHMLCILGIFLYVYFHIVTCRSNMAGSRVYVYGDVALGLDYYFFPVRSVLSSSKKISI